MCDTDREGAERKSMVFPRRWLDIYGRKLDEMWEAALRAVVGQILLRPGISQVRTSVLGDSMIGAVVDRCART